MSRITHVLDTSAILSHYFDEPGADKVALLWQKGNPKPAVCVVTIPELRSRLAIELSDPGEAEQAIHAYIEELTTSVSVDRMIAELAVQIRIATPKRLPLVDALISACARAHDALLVHCDPHMAEIPKGMVRQLIIPGG